MSLESILKFILICLLIFQAPELSLFLCYEMLTHISKSKVSKGAKIRNRYNQVPHLTQDTNGKVSRASFVWDIEKHTDLEQTPHKAVFDQGLHYWYTEYSFKT